MTLAGFTSFFNPGRLDVFVEAFACTTVCLGDFIEGAVNARPIPNKPGPPPPPPPPPPANDERAGAFAIGLGDTVDQDVAGATASETDPTDCGPQGTFFSNSTVWYAFTADGDGFVDLDTLDSDYDTTLFVLDGDAIVACNDQAPFSNQSALTFAASAGTTYDIMVGAWEDSPPGHLVLRAMPGTEPPPPPPTPANDERADAVPLEVDGPSLEGDTDAATVNLDTDPQECPFAGFPQSEHTVWYSVTAAADGWVEVNTVGSDYDTTLYVLDPTDAVIACNDDTFGLQSQVIFPVTAGFTYHVMVGTFDASPGGHLVVTALSAEEPPPPPLPLEIELTLNPTGTVNTRTGEVTIGGSLTCSRDAAGFFFVGASQTGGRFTAEGFTDAELTCGTEPSAWSATLFGNTAKFQAGDAFVFVDVFLQAEDGQDAGDFIESTVALRPVGSAR